MPPDLPRARARRSTRPAGAPRGAFLAAALAVAVLPGVGAGAVGATPPAGATTTAIAAPAARGVVAQDSGLPAPEPSADEARRQADEILARGEYQEPPKSLIERITEWGTEQLGKLFSSFSGGTGGALAWVILAVLVGVAIFLLSRVRAGVFARRPREGEALFETSLEARRSPTEWLREADQLEASGRWKDGLRARYRALVGTLIAEQLLRDIPGRTAGEYRVELRRAAPHLAADFQAATDLFERAWYGDEPTGPAESERFRALATHLDTQLRQPVAAATGGPAGPVAPA